MKKHVADSKLSVSVLSFLFQLKSQLEIASLRGDSLQQVKSRAENLIWVHEPKDRRMQQGYMLTLKQEADTLIIEKHLPNRTLIVATVTQEQEVLS